MAKTEKRVFDSEEDLAVSLAKYIDHLSDQFAKKKGLFTVVLSGGSLIECLRKLVEPPYVDSIDWSIWHIFWLDERVVPKTHVDSNYKLAYDGFLSKGSNDDLNCKVTLAITNNLTAILKSILEHDSRRFIVQVPIPPGNVYAIDDTLSAEGAAEEYEARLKHLVDSKVIDISAKSGFPKFDLNLLGMGPDGHVASLFPGHLLLKENKKWVTFIKDSPKPPPERITLTFPVINSSDYIALVVPGDAQADAVSIALGGGNHPTAEETLPVQRVAPEGLLTWFLDKDAASKL
uniref:Probable 6-phosphogluconolactonase n=1 Tax=Cucumis melo TaxID=3656 RepID=A0A9I9CMQ2_CUCME